ncbi:MAG: hypothetical protein HYY26_03080 [Acidobacteria bacterium]|nr:hypothetical protein [Acidobacteriota bacterium]
MRHGIRWLVWVAVVAGLVGLSGGAPAQEAAGKIHVWVARNYNSWDNPLHSEFIVNGTTVNIYTSDTFEPIEQHLQPGWNTITIKTTPQEPANADNDLIFRLGPMRQDPRDKRRMVMEPVLWEFRNGTDWKFDRDSGTYGHPLGPGVKEVELTYRFYYAGLELENQKLEAGDIVLHGKPNYNSWNSPVLATVWVNGTPLNSFLLEERQIVITGLLRPGKNEIKLVSQRVKNSIADNDILFEIAGPAEWYVDRNQYVLAPLVQFKAAQGWRKDARTGQLSNPANPQADTIERTVPFMLKEPPKAQ